MNFSCYLYTQLLTIKTVDSQGVETAANVVASAAATGPLLPPLSPMLAGNHGRRAAIADSYYMHYCQVVFWARRC